MSRKKLNEIITRAQSHGWTIRNYDATYTFLGLVDAAGRFCTLTVTRSTGRITAGRPVPAGKHNA